MSLISPKNFTAPLTNTVNLALILVIALIFGLYRWSGGGIGISNRKAPAQTVKQAPESKVEQPSTQAASSTTADKTKPSALRPPEDDVMYEDLLVKGKSKSARNPGSKAGSSLDDIAKQLGVE